MEYHVPVMLTESINGLNINPQGIYVDVTFGGGGHSREILKQLGKNGLLIALDRDNDALKNSLSDNRFKLYQGDFRFLRNYLSYAGIEKVDGILADFGISSYQIDNIDRGFSFRLGGELDMRMNKLQKLTAKEILNYYSHEKLTYIFKNYGEVDRAYKLASIIISYRETKNIETVEEFLNLIRQLTQKQRENKFFAQVFQSLRIEVNQEIESIKEFLFAARESLKIGGRLVTITYHSIEDRVVKNFIKYGNFDGNLITDRFGNIKTDFLQVNKKVIIPSDEEMNNNPRSRSAKLRIAERL
ncbi:MAG: 16S rRNA (cytosine(1402)-N(4))-methyltransferase RsmH [Bacteroidales bacterium]|jgi:16S rRNA (cytosine1402-N4)-methyltransferase|nr:16S rRNA (cytosine(1402)-N(4))-methyltransferase RsmH [Bacteroidales bacterium]HOL97723.1 16S rRNA (cytosine(1402)-N(4))-methyltransferase RsmH [Bacteroidales bacterium]HOM36324.1 16S rRNA (cytosine(1402)-N(4))-methyltransferase RsmH [Bacteroidales bacterium]HPD23608.1 16S rRNA (cytosine(1402)-N(4))-methyltransferase RsmH [Bacteroidales bacterium]HRS99479.1 16S rRNA (cytosine(1402)-N(4))-methyltransferase RsmH [Bacteroidales bacterium]